MIFFLQEIFLFEVFMLHVSVYLCFQSKDGGGQLRCLLVFGAFVNLQLLQLSLCHPQLLSQSLSVQRLLLQVLLNKQNTDTGHLQRFTLNCPVLTRESILVSD